MCGESRGQQGGGGRSRRSGDEEQGGDSLLDPVQSSLRVLHQEEGRGSVQGTFPPLSTTLT